MSEEITLREYQDSSVEELRAGIRNGKKNQVLCSGTGSGKTVVAAYLIDECFKKGMRAVFVCDRIALIDQTSEVFDKYGIPHGVIQSDHWRRRPGETIQVASAQTLMRRGWPKADLILVDEAHTLHKTTMERIAQRDCITIGLTATPFSKGMGKFYDGVVNVISTNKLIEDKFLVPFRVFAASEPDMTGCKTVAGEWTDKDASERSMPIIGDCVAEYLKHGQWKKFIAFGVDVAHCTEMKRQFMAAGVHCELYTYKTPDSERSTMVKEFRKPDSFIRGLISCSALSKGFDVSDVGAIIMCRPLRKSLAEHIQILGRGLRIHPGKEECLVLDHSGNFIRFWDEMHEFFEDGIHELDNGEKKEKKKKEEKEKKPAKCPKCSHVHPRCPVCPACGHEYVVESRVEHESGVLKEIGGSINGSAAKRQLFAELKGIAQSRGWSEGRLSHVFRDITTVWPNAYKDEPAQAPSQDTLNKVRHLTLRFVKSQQGKEWLARRNA